MRIVLDAGHGGPHWGRTVLTPSHWTYEPLHIHPGIWGDPSSWAPASSVFPNMIREKDINLLYVRLLAHELRQLGARVRLVRGIDVALDSGVGADLKKRVELVNLDNPDCLISIHCNGFDDPRANGFEVWTTPGITASDLLAREIFFTLKTALPMLTPRPDMSDGDVDKEANFYILKHTRCPAVLVELGFLTHPRDLDTICDAETVGKVTAGIAKAAMGWWKAKLNV